MIDVYYNKHVHVCTNNKLTTIVHVLKYMYAVQSHTNYLHVHSHFFKAVDYCTRRNKVRTKGISQLCIIIIKTTHACRYGNT